MKVTLKNGDHVEVSPGEANDLINWGLATLYAERPRPKRKVTRKKTSTTKVETPAEEPQVEVTENPEKENE